MTKLLSVHRPRVPTTIIEKPSEKSRVSHYAPGSAGPVLSVYETRSAWASYAPVLLLSLLLGLVFLAFVWLVLDGWVQLSQIGLESQAMELEHARLLAAEESYSLGQVVALVGAVLLGVLALPSLIFVRR